MSSLVVRGATREAALEANDRLAAQLDAWQAEGRIRSHGSVAGLLPARSTQIERLAPHVSTSAKNVVNWSKAILAESDKVLAAETAEAAAEPTKRIAELTQHILEGTDADEDGKIGWQAGEGGIAQAKAHLGFLMGS